MILGDCIYRQRLRLREVEPVRNVMNPAVGLGCRGWCSFAGGTVESYGSDGFHPKRRYARRGRQRPVPV